jgi:hypothetical protein
MVFIDKDNLTIVKKNRAESIYSNDKNIARVRLTLEAGEAKPGAVIAPVLGPLQINAIEFCKRFNEVTSKYEVGLPLCVYVFKKMNNKFEIEVKLPSFYFLLWVMLLEGELKEIKIELLYDLIRVENQLIGGKLSIKRMGSLIFGVKNELKNVKILF